MSRPGERVRNIACRLLAEQTMERIIDPMLADLQCEYEEARARGQRWRARLGLVRSYCAFAKVLFWIALRPAVQTENRRAAAARTSAVLAVASLVATIALLIPPILAFPWWQRDPGFTALLSLTLVPQALPLSIPAGLCVAVMWSMRGRVVTGRRVSMVLTMALSITIVVWAVLEWVMPHANQGFREIIAARLSDGRVVALEPGLNEMGLSRLGERSDPAAVRQYQLLWALCFASAPLSLMALGLARYVRRAASAVALAVALVNFYFALVWACAISASTIRLPAAMSAWTPNAIFLVIGFTLLVRAPRPTDV